MVIDMHGVTFDASRSKWRARITIDGRTVEIGRFCAKEDAEQARANAEHEHGSPRNEAMERRRQSDLGALFRYENGVLYWKHNPGRPDMVGKIAGCMNKSLGYWIISVHNKRCYRHRLIWEMFNGAIPDGGEVDHINRIRSDDRIENLRPVSHRENNQNKTKQSNNTSGNRGVSFYKAYSKWVAYIKTDGKMTHLGYFPTFEEAKAARLRAEQEMFTHGPSP